MRAAILLIGVLAGAGILYWQAPTALPGPARAVFHLIETGWSALIARIAQFDAGAPAGLPPLGLMIAATALLAVLAIALVVARARAVHGRETSAAAWASTAKPRADLRDRFPPMMRRTELMSSKAMPDVRARGEKALAGAHQLDLYWRYVARAEGAARGAAKGIGLERWRKVTQSALRSLEQSPASGALATLDRLKAGRGGGTESLAGYYERLGALVAQYESAYAKAQAAVAQPKMDQKACLDAMEELREINRAIARESAAIVGDIEISVRALS